MLEKGDLDGYAVWRARHGYVGSRSSTHTLHTIEEDGPGRVRKPFAVELLTSTRAHPHVYLSLRDKMPLE